MQSSKTQQHPDRREDDSRPLHMTVRIGQIPGEGDPQSAQQQPQAAKDGVPVDAAARSHGGENDQNKKPEPVHHVRKAFSLPEIKLIPVTEHRWTTLGTWVEREDGSFQVLVARMSRWQYELCILAHELVEWAICQRDGVSTKDCDDFDDLWESEFQAGKHSLEAEAGFDRRCPYRRGHVLGTRVEWLLCRLLGVSWSQYCADCMMALEVLDR